MVLPDVEIEQVVARSEPVAAPPSPWCAYEHRASSSHRMPLDVVAARLDRKVDRRQRDRRRGPANRSRRATPPRHHPLPSPARHRRPQGPAGHHAGPVLQAARSRRRRGCAAGCLPPADRPPFRPHRGTRSHDSVADATGVALGRPGSAAVLAAQDRYRPVRRPDSRVAPMRASASRCAVLPLDDTAPGRATVAGPHDGPALAHGETVQSVGETDRIEPGGLGLDEGPVHATVARRHDDAAVADRPDMVPINRCHAAQRLAAYRRPARSKFWPLSPCLSARRPGRRLPSRRCRT